MFVRGVLVLRGVEGLKVLLGEITLVDLGVLMLLGVMLLDSNLPLEPPTADLPP